MTMNYTRALPPDVLMEVQDLTNGSGQYSSSWADCSGYTKIRVFVTAAGLSSSSVVSVVQGFAYPEPGTPSALLTETIPVVANPSGGYVAYGEVDAYMRSFQVTLASGPNNQQILISARGVETD